jgi:hypothetical protein
LCTVRMYRSGSLRMRPEEPPDVQDALVRILSTTELFDLLVRGEVDRLSRTLSLSAPAAESLRAINLSGVRRFREILQAKHLRHAQEALPLSMAVAVDLLGRDTVREGLWTRAPLPRNPVGELGHRYLPLAVTYVQSLRSGVPPWMSDVARFEGMLVELGMAEATTDLGAVPADGTPARIRLADGVRLERFGWDVTEILPRLPEIDSRTAPREVLVVARSLGRGLDIRRVGALAYAILDRCRRPVRPRSVIETVVPDRAAVAERFVADATAMGLLVDAGGAR